MSERPLEIEERAQQETANVETYSKLHIYFTITCSLSPFFISHFLCMLHLYFRYICIWTATCNCLHRTNWCAHTHSIQQQQQKRIIFYFMNYLHNMAFGLHCLAIWCVYFFLLRLDCILSYKYICAVYCFASFQCDKSLKFGFKRFRMQKCN